ncbi:tail fiber assembly protein [Pseudomonas phage P413]|nr:tail fiber assembly protein [Pseudomonas phage P413]
MEFPKEFTMLEVLAIENPRWTSKEHIQIDVDLTARFPDNRVETFPYTSCPFDTFSDHCPAIFEHAAQMPNVKEYERPNVTVEDLQAEFDKIWPDVVLGLADEKTISLATDLRKQIKVMS